MRAQTQRVRALITHRIREIKMTKLVVVLLTSLLLVSIALTYELATRPKASGGFGEDTQVLGEVEYTLFKKGQDFPDLLFVFHGVIEGNGVWWPIAWSGEGGILQTYCQKPHN